MFTRAVISLLGLSALASSHPMQCEGKATAKVGKAVYFMTNEEANTVAALPIGANGSLSGGSATETGGRGGAGIDGASGKAAVTDPLFSQSSLSIAGHSLFVVNAGSNSVSMLAIDPRDPTQLKMVGKPVSVPGDFPVTIAASASNGLVCVGMTGEKSGVSCANFDELKGMGAMDELRPFDLGQSTPPTGPTNTVSQVFWSEGGASLLVTVKGDPAVNNTGFLSEFSTSVNGRIAALATEDTRVSPNGTAVLFGSAPIADTNNVFVTDASFGGAIVSREGDLIASQAVDGQTATCWVTIARTPSGKSAFVTDVGVPRLVEMSLDDASILGEMDLSDTGATGLIDLASAGDFVYALAPSAGEAKTQVLVMQAGAQGQGKLIDAFSADQLGAGALSQGMAILL